MPIGEVPDVGEPMREGKGEYEGDPRWPAQCASCSYRFTDADVWQVFREDVYAAALVMPGAALTEGRETTLREAPAGAMWFADWMPFFLGPDGRCLVVKTPGGDWMVDSRASNCTMPEDDVHRCWIRHGDAPMVTVDKQGNTCAAGAGSIQSGDYHGFLQQGVLT